MQPQQNSKYRKLFLAVFGLLAVVGVSLGIKSSLMTPTIISPVTDPRDALVVSASSFSKNAKGEKIIAGILENITSNETYTDIVVDMEFLDETGAVVGKRFVFTSSLGPKEAWPFESTVVPPKAQTFRTTITTSALD
jgi:hypothetical protein